MKGHIRERSPGHWAIVIDVRDPKTVGRNVRRRSSALGSFLRCRAASALIRLV